MSFVAKVQHKRISKSYTNAHWYRESSQKNHANFVSSKTPLNILFATSVLKTLLSLNSYNLPIKVAKFN